MAKKKEMDQLTAWSLEAERLGMSYGAYVAKYHPKTPSAERFSKKSKNAVRTADGKKICQWCGKEIPPNAKSWKYCGQVCAYAAHEDQKMKRND